MARLFMLVCLVGAVTGCISDRDDPADTDPAIPDAGPSDGVTPDRGRDAGPDGGVPTDAPALDAMLRDASDATPTDARVRAGDAAAADAGGNPFDASLDAGRPDVGLDAAGPDATLDAASPDAIVDAAPPDAIVDAAPPDAIVDAAPPDAIFDAAPPDAIFDAAPPVISLDAVPPDAIFDAAPPVISLDAVPPDAILDADTPDAAVAADAAADDAGPAVEPCDGCAEPECAADPRCLTTLCRSAGGCDDPRCWSHPVCCAEQDLGSAMGRAVATGPICFSARGPDLEPWALNESRFKGPCGGAGEPERAMAWTAPQTGRYIVHGMPERPVHFNVDLRAGCVPDVLACAEAGVHGAPVQFDAVEGESFVIVAGPAYQTVCVDFTLDIVRAADPTMVVCPDDPPGGPAPECACVAGSLVGPTATPIAGEAYLWTALEAGRHRFQIEGAIGAAPSICLRRGDCLSEDVICHDDGEPDAPWQAVAEVATGETIRVHVQWDMPPASPGTLRITREDTEAHCADAQDEDRDGATDCEDPDCADHPACACRVVDIGSGLGREAYAGFTAGFGHRVTPGCHDPDEGAMPDLVVAWTAPFDGRFRFSGPGRGRSPGSLSRVDGCDGGEAECGDEIVAELAAGERIHLRVDTPPGPWALWVEATDRDEQLCGDGVDDDGDGALDCDDGDCRDAIECRGTPDVCPDDDPRCIDRACRFDPACFAQACGSPGMCAHGACRAHAVCTPYDHDLGSAIGPNVGGGTTMGRPQWRDRSTPNPRFPGGWMAPHLDFRWTAPSEGEWHVLVRPPDQLDGARPLDPLGSLPKGSRAGFRRLSSRAGEQFIITVDGEQAGEHGPFAIDILPAAGPGYPVPTPCLTRTQDDTCYRNECVQGCGCLTGTLSTRTGRSVDVVVDLPRPLDAEMEPLGVVCGEGRPLYAALWIAPAAGEYAFTVRPHALDLRPTLEFYSGCSPRRDIACGLPDAETGEASVTRRFAAGESMVIAVDGLGEPGGFDLDIVALDEQASCADGRDDDGDGAVDCDDPDCADAPACRCAVIELGEALGRVFTGGTPGNAHRVSPSCGSPGIVDARLAWTAPAAGTYTLQVNGDLDPVVAVLDGGCDGAEIACAAGQVSVELDAGERVLVAVEGTRGRGRSAGHFTLDIRAD